MTKESRQRRENESSRSEEKSRKVRSEQKVRLERMQADKEKKKEAGKTYFIVKMMVRRAFYK